eukprot:TRINITY_DN23381_c0_g1_i1.p1 TRINITY_DN23381_c0_g1~~TRINITY_DN23381_c0_g1_i1.p1  ORF type:complete len:516 (+),score=105.39 TRINITY_DN23381_c0_g1_i1:76-1623(+)
MRCGRGRQLVCSVALSTLAAALVFSTGQDSGGPAWTDAVNTTRPPSAADPVRPAAAASPEPVSGSVWRWPEVGELSLEAAVAVDSDMRTAKFRDLPAYKPGNRTAMMTDNPHTTHHRLLAGHALPLSAEPASSLWPCLPKAEPAGDDGATVWLPWVEGMTQVPVSCPVRCDIETRRDQVKSADAFVVDLAREWAHDWMIYDWKKNPLGKILVGWNIENIEGRRKKLSRAYRHRYIGKNWTASFWEKFDIAVSYPLGSDVPLNYYHWAACRDRETSVAIRKHARRKADRKGHRAAAFLSSNCDFTSHWRDAFALQLRKHFPVHGFGRCLHTHSVDSVGCGLSKKGAQKACVFSQYPFAVVAENSVSIDYVTEKVYEPLLAGAVPVYLGAPNVENFLPTSTAAILAADFPTIAALGRYLACLIDRPSDLQRYLDWPERTPFRSWRFFRDAYPPLCAVCMHVADAKKRGEPRAWLRRFKETMPGGWTRRPKVVPYVFAENKGAQKPLQPCYSQALGGG